MSDDADWISPQIRHAGQQGVKRSTRIRLPLSEDWSTLVLAAVAVDHTGRYKYLSVVSRSLTMPRLRISSGSEPSQTHQLGTCTVDLGQKKRTWNVQLHGHRTSIRLEPIFWEMFTTIAAREMLTPHQVCEIIDPRRGDASLTSAIRLFVISYCYTLRREIT